MGLIGLTYYPKYNIIQDKLRLHNQILFYLRFNIIYKSYEVRKKLTKTTSMRAEHTNLLVQVFPVTLQHQRAAQYNMGNVP